MKATRRPVYRFSAVAVRLFSYPFVCKSNILSCLQVTNFYEKKKSCEKFRTRIKSPQTFLSLRTFVNKCCNCLDIPATIIFPLSKISVSLFPFSLYQFLSGDEMPSVSASLLIQQPSYLNYILADDKKIITVKTSKGHNCHFVPVLASPPVTDPAGS